MLEAYRQHVEERAAEGVPPKPLNEQQVAELVELLHRPSTDPGALESFRGFVNLFRDHLAPDLLSELRLPVRLLWGGLDPWEAPAEARRWAATGAGHRARVLPGCAVIPASA